WTCRRTGSSPSRPTRRAEARRCIGRRPCTGRCRWSLVVLLVVFVRLERIVDGNLFIGQGLIDGLGALDVLEIVVDLVVRLGVDVGDVAGLVVIELERILGVDVDLGIMHLVCHGSSSQNGM